MAGSKSDQARISINQEIYTTLWPSFQQAAVMVPRVNPTCGNPAWDEAEARVLIVRLSPFRDVDRSQPHLFLAQAVRRALPHAYVDFAFFPSRADRERWLEAGIPLLHGIFSWQPATAFDLLLISNAYTLELINVPYLLLHSGLPLWSDERSQGPLVLLGGSNALATQALIRPDGQSLVDGLFFGEGEGHVERLLQDLQAHADQPKAERLRLAAERVPGFWPAGDLARPVTRAQCLAPRRDDLLLRYPILNSAEAATAKLQITYGCPAFCSFCFEGYDRKPYREVPLPDLLAAARDLKAATGAEEVELYSFNFNTHRDISALLLELNRLFARVSFKSQRVDLLATTPGLLAYEVLADKRSFTLGVEGISARQRAFLHKSLPDQALDTVLAQLLRQKIREIKLFYILTGYESEADFREFREWLRAFKALRQRTNPGVRVIFSFGLLVRLPFTPLRYDRLFLDEAHWRPLIGQARSACETNGFEFRLATAWEEYAWDQVLALGDYRLSAGLVELARQGYCYDQTLPPGAWPALRAWLETQGLWNEAFWSEKGPDYEFPLAFVRGGVSPRFLYQQYQAARAGVDAGYCLGTTCAGCAACVTPQQRAALLNHQVAPPSLAAMNELETLMTKRRRLPPLIITLDVPDLAAGTTPEWLRAFVLRALLAALPEQVDNLLAAQEVLFTRHDFRERFDLGLTGRLPFALTAWDAPALQAALEAHGPELAEGMRWVALLPTVPQAFARVELRLDLPPALFPSAHEVLRDFLRAEYVPCNLRRQGEGWTLDLPAQALKKKMVLAGHYTPANGELRLTAGPKFDLRGYLERFPLPGAWRAAHIRVEGWE